MFNSIKKYLNKSLSVIIANAVFSLTQFILISIMTKFYDLGSVGSYSYILALIVPIITFAGLNLRALQLTDVTNKYLFADYFVVRTIGALVTVLVVLILTIINETTFFAIAVTGLVLIRKTIELFIEAAHSKLIKEGRLKEYSVSLIMIGSLSVTAFWLGSLFINNFLISLALYTLVWLVVFIFYDAKNAAIKKEFKDYKFNRKATIGIIAAALPLAIVATVNVLYTNIPRIFIETYINLEAVAIFSSISYIALIGNIFITGITLIFSTKLADINHRGEIKKFLKIIFLQNLLVILCCSLLFVTFYFKGDLLLEIIYTIEFIKYNDVVLLLIVAISLSFTAKVFGTACTSAQKNKEQFYVALGCITLLIISCFVLIPNYYLKGAAVALIFTYLLKNLLLFFILIKHYFSFKEAFKTHIGIGD